MSEQNFANHAKYVPAYHFFAVPALTLNFGWSIYRWKAAGFSLDGFVTVLAAAALVVLCFAARLFALKVQDRVIRLEERLRYERLLPEDLKGRIGEFTVSQLAALRFASDADLPGLARNVLGEKMDDRKQIKLMVQNWKADHWRA